MEGGNKRNWCHHEGVHKIEGSLHKGERGWQGKKPGSATSGKQMHDNFRDRERRSGKKLEE